MQWPFKTTVKFASADGRITRLLYAVSADNKAEAKNELERRFLRQEVFGYVVENVVAATGSEAAEFDLPNGCIQLLG